MRHQRDAHAPLSIHYVICWTVSSLELLHHRSKAAGPAKTMKLDFDKRTIYLFFLPCRKAESWSYDPAGQKTKLIVQKAREEQLLQKLTSGSGLFMRSKTGEEGRYDTNRAHHPILAYPNREAARYVIQAQATWRIARYFSTNRPRLQPTLCSASRIGFRRFFV